MKTRRSPRAGWRLIVLDGDRWRTALVGDREAVKTARMETVRPWLGGGLPWHPGRCAAVYDALGQLRDAFPSRPRLADGETRWTSTRVELPLLGAPADGSPVVRIARAPGAEVQP